MVNFPPKVPGTNSNSSSGIAKPHVSDCMNKINTIKSTQNEGSVHFRDY